jgi:hypothetical protein
VEISITDAEITVSGSLSIRRSRRITYTAICNDASIVRRRVHGDAHLKNFAILYENAQSPVLRARQEHGVHAAQVQIRKNTETLRRQASTSSRRSEV